MSHDRPSEPDRLEWLLREHLDRRAAETDTTALVANLQDILGDSPADAVGPSPRTEPRRVSDDAWWKRAGFWFVTTTAAVLFAFVVGRSVAPSVADAKTILRDVQINHSQTVDRCYQVQFAPAPGYWNGKNPLKGPSETVLWTRGDRFWADATLGSVKLVYGRDERGSLWVSPDRSRGIRLSGPGERLPDEIAMYCKINSMTVPALVEDVLVDFDLRTDPPKQRPPEETTGQPDPVTSGNTVVWAQRKPGRSHKQIASALLEIDANRTLVRLILWTVDEGRPRGTVTFTLIKSGHQDDEQYRLESHLDSTAEIKKHRFDTPKDNADEK